MVQARNVLPMAGGGYGPFPSPVDAGIALPGESRGGITASVPGGATFTYVGTQTAIYVRSGDTSGWTNVSKPGGYALGDAGWEFVQYGTKVIAVGGPSVPIQVNEVGGPAFADMIPPSSARRPRAYHIALIYGIPVLAHTFDDQDGEQPNRVWWPQIIQIPNLENWAPNLSTFAGYSGSLPQAGDGAIRAVIGGEVGIIWSERAIYRMRYLGSAPKIFDIERVERGRGPIAAGAVIDDGRMTYFIDRDGFYAFDGQQATPIGHGKVNRAIARRMNTGAVDTIKSATIPGLAVVMWALPLDGSPKPNKLIAYSVNDGRFTEIDLGASLVLETASPGISWDEEPWASRPLDQEPWASYVWDSPSFLGGDRTLTMFDSAGKMFFLTGAGLPALLETQEVAPFEPYVAEWTDPRPVVDDASAGTTVSVGVRSSVAEEVFWGPDTKLNRIGFAPVRERGVYTRMRLKIPAGFRHAIGIAATPRKGGLA
jgi:hypothetical protein